MPPHVIAPRSREMISGGDPNSPMRTWAQMAPPRKPVTRIAEDGGGWNGIKDGAGEYDRTHDTGQVHREPGFLQHARNLCRREKLNSAVCHQSDNDKRAHYPAGPQGAMQGHGFRQLMQFHGFGHLSFSDGGYQYLERTVSLRYDKH